MYYYDFKINNEQVLNEATDVNMKFNDKWMIVNILLTNKNIIFFNNIDSRFEVLFKVSLSNMNYNILEDNTILNIDEFSVTLYNFNIDEFIKDN